MQQAQRPIHSLLHDDMRGAHTALDLVELAAVGHGPIPPEHPARPQGHYGPHLRADRKRAMQVSRLRRLDGKAPVVLRPPHRQELIRLRQGGDAGQAHLLHQPILQGVKESFDASLCLGRMRGDQLDAQVPERPSKLTRRGDAGSLLFHRRFRGGAIGRMLIRMDGKRNPVLFDVPLETVEGRHRPFILIEPGIHPAAHIIDVGHQDTARAAAFEPIMMGAIQLHQFAAVRAAGPPGAMRSRVPPEMLNPLRAQPAPQRLITECVSAPML